MFRKITVAGFLLTLSGSVLAASDSATVTISATVKANTCTLKDPAPVVLPDVSVGDFGGKVYSRVGRKEISIELIECGSGTTGVKVTAGGIADSNLVALWANSIEKDNGGASGVGLRFLQTGDQNTFYPGGSRSEVISLISGADNTLTFYAYYEASLKEVTAGLFSTAINMTFEYQ